MVDVTIAVARLTTASRIFHIIVRILFSYSSNCSHFIVSFLLVIVIHVYACISFENRCRVANFCRSKNT